jgi:hypothetical protein
MLEDVARRNGRSVMRLMGVAPHLVFSDARAELVSEGVYRGSAMLQNTGFLPTWLSEYGKKTRHIRPIKAKLEMPADVSLVSERNEIEVGQLDGRATSYESFSFFPRYGNLTRKRVSWVVRGVAGTVVSLQAEATKGGVASTTVTLPEA